MKSETCPYCGSRSIEPTSYPVEWEITDAYYCRECTGEFRLSWAGADYL